MATTPVTPAPAPSAIATDLSWIKTHAILLLFVVGLALLGVFEIERVIAKHDAERDTQAQAALQAVVSQVGLMQTALKADEANWQQINSAQLALINQLNLRIGARDTAVKTQVTKDATLSAVEAAQKIQTQTGASDTAVVPQANTVVLDLPTARTVVQNLDTLPAVQADLADTQKQLAAETTVANDNAADAAEQKKLLAAMQTQIADGDKACQAQITSLKADARKSKLKWFGIGVAVGATIRSLLPF